MKTRAMILQSLISCRVTSAHKLLTGLLPPLVWLALGSASTQAQEPYRLQQATMNETHIVFSHAGDLWKVARSGGEAERVTRTPGQAGNPMFSPDGQWLAYSAGASLRESDVFIMPAMGGPSEQRTFHPAPDAVRGWTSDSRRILFASSRERAFEAELFTIGLDDAMPQRLPLPDGNTGSFSPDNRLFAYLRNDASGSWRHYRGGLLSDIDLVDLEAGKIVDTIPRDNVRDRFPMWIDNTIYFVSDRAGTHNLFAYDRQTKRITQHTFFERYGIRHASTSSDGIVLIVDGRLHIYDWEADTTLPVPLTFPERAFLDAATKRVPVDRWLDEGGLSHEGNQLALIARGDVLTLDLASGNQQINAASGSAEHNVVWSPDGTQIAYFSDASGEYALYLHDAAQLEEPVVISIEAEPTFYRELTWSPDGRWLAFSGQRLGLWLVDVPSGTSRKITTSEYIAQGEFTPDWSPDGRWLTYAQASAYGIRSVYVYDTASDTHHRLTDGMTQSEYPVFDRNGHYLYFVASNNARMASASDVGWGLYSSQLNRPLVSKQLHVIVLSELGHAPLLPVLQQPNPAALRQKPCDNVHIDLAHIERRVLPLPVEPRDIQGLYAGAMGELFVHAIDWPHTPGAQTFPRQPLLRYRWTEPRRFDRVQDDVRGVQTSEDGSTLLFQKQQMWHIARTTTPDQSRPLSFGSASLEIDVHAEWQQMYNEVWRKVRDMFYDPNIHGQNIDSLHAHYAHYLPNIRNRQELNGLFSDMLGHLSVSHLRIFGGDSERSRHSRPATGLLGADFRIQHGRYQFTKVYQPSAFMHHNHLAQAPLAQAGVTVEAGDYLLAIDGEAITTDRNVYSYFTDHAYQAVTLTIGPHADGRDARTITVVPTSNEYAIRQAAWAETNRQHVAERSNGRLGYLFIGDYSTSIPSFIRQLIGQQDKDGLVIDQRFNGGGVTLDHIIELLQRKPLYHYAYRYGADFTVMPNVIDGPKTVLINEKNGSAAETFPFMFKLAGLGPIVGTRTIGAGIGAALFQAPLVDGGRIAIPNRASFNPNGSWDIENYGVTPDYTVVNSLQDWHQSHDAQLETAIELMLDALKSYQKHDKIRPAYPVHPN